MNPSDFFSTTTRATPRTYYVKGGAAADGDGGQRRANHLLPRRQGSDSDELFLFYSLAVAGRERAAPSLSEPGTGGVDRVSPRAELLALEKARRAFHRRTHVRCPAPLASRLFKLWLQPASASLLLHSSICRHRPNADVLGIYISASAANNRSSTVIPYVAARVPKVWWLRGGRRRRRR